MIWSLAVTAPIGFNSQAPSAVSFGCLLPYQKICGLILRVRSSGYLCDKFAQAPGRNQIGQRISGFKPPVEMYPSEKKFSSRSRASDLK
jgi:hypothetical protein